MVGIGGRPSAWDGLDGLSPRLQESRMLEIEVCRYEVTLIHHAVEVRQSDSWPSGPQEPRIQSCVSTSWPWRGPGLSLRISPFWLFDANRKEEKKKTANSGLIA